ncbi:insulinase family protein [Synechococcus sp. CS-1329]|uniref:M16 family metallopeptidase n=1 Tax=Synechococcus sp. CS-1329 TaxID=2847975 RepID=UPI00223BF881|nr:pitrilysin family protein [Synechococcus sp. CS-1329]MCT0219168.1 insulinase family protein [Synechococcus sp. CS-1329]
MSRSTPLPPLPQPERFELPGGCPVSVLHRQGPAILSARLWIRGGSAADPPGQRGRAQLLAGLLSRGCGDLSGDQLADLVEGLGDELRCEACEDAMVISLKCASDDAPALLPLLGVMVQRPWLDPDQISLERQLNLQTLGRLREDPFQQAHDQLRSHLFGQGPYGHDPLGVEVELAGLDRPQLLDAAAVLGGQGAALVLVGRPPAGLEELLQPPDSPAWSSRSASLLNGQGAQNEPGLLLEEQDTEQLVLMLGTATVPLADPRSLALRLLQCHLGVGMSSRLFVALREDHGLAYDVGVHAPARCGAAPFVFHLSSSAERAAEATRELLAEWQRLLDQPLSEEELALAIAKFRGASAAGRQTCGQIADRQAMVLGHGLGWSYADEALERADSLDAATLHAVARQLLSRPSLSLCGPPEALRAAGTVWGAHPLGRPSGVQALS